MEALRLAALTHLQSLSFDELDRLAARAEEQSIPIGRRLLLAGALHHELAVVAAGRGVVRCAGEAVDELGPGDVFGALSTRRGSYETATIHAASALQLVVFSNRAMRDLRRTAPDAVDALLAACSLDAHERVGALSGPRPAPELTLVSAAAA
jgi:CRP-like cAMP-binding protein